MHDFQDQGAADVQAILEEHPKLIMVTSAGNEGPGLGSMGSPAHARDVIAAGNYVTKEIVSSLWHSEVDGDQPYYGSCRGGVTDNPTCMAPGFHVSTVPSYERTEAWQGTSMACPHVAGLAAVLRAAAPGLTNDDIRQVLRATADDLGDPGFDIYFGYGRINAANTIAAISTPCTADLTGDDQVNIDDIFAVLGLWGNCDDPCPPYCLGDLTEDCTVNIDDIFAILGMWGPCE